MARSYIGTVKVLLRVGATIVQAPRAIFDEANAIFREGLVERNRLALVWVATVAIVVAIALSFWVFRINVAASGGWFLLLLFFVGIFLALAASVDERPTRRVVWGNSASASWSPGCWPLRFGWWASCGDRSKSGRRCSRCSACSGKCLG